MSARGDARRKLAELLAAALVGNGLPAQAVYAWQVGDFAGQSPVVAVTSGPANHEPNGFGCDKAVFQLFVYVFVAYAVPGAGWTEEHAEDALDDIRAVANSRLGKTQRVSALYAIDEMPRSHIGKLLKTDLREIAQAK